MKKRLGILSAILVLALTLAVVFAMLASAETVVEAKLGFHTCNRNFKVKLIAQCHNVSPWSRGGSSALVI